MKFPKVLISALLLFVSALGLAQESEEKHPIHDSIAQHTDSIYSELIETRRDFHMHPEVSENEKRTSEKIARYLSALGLEVKTNIGGYGIVGILNGDKQGKSVAWRADIDAMPSEIPDVVDFESVNPGVRHICGHDVHAAIGLGIANVLSGRKNELKGKVYFIFQPSEENYKGAEAMIGDGLLDQYNIGEVYGIHISPFPVGTISTKPGNVYAHTNRVKVIYKSDGRDEEKINYTKKLISQFQNVAAGSEFFNLENLGHPEIGIESPNTIFKDFFTVKENFSIEKNEDLVMVTATLNSSDKEQLDSFLKTLREKIRQSDYSADLQSVLYTYEKAVVNNDESLTKKSITDITHIYGEESFIPMYGQITGDRGDDFAYFQKYIPGVYFFLGGANYDTGVISMPHTPDFNVDEESIRFGVKFFSSLLAESIIGN